MPYRLSAKRFVNSHQLLLLLHVLGAEAVCQRIPVLVHDAFEVSLPPVWTRGRIRCDASVT